MSVHLIPEGIYEVLEGPTEKEIVVSLMQNLTQQPEPKPLSFKTEAGFVTIDAVGCHRAGLELCLFGLDETWRTVSVTFDPIHRTGELTMGQYTSFD